MERQRTWTCRKATTRSRLRRLALHSVYSCRFLSSLCLNRAASCSLLCLDHPAVLSASLLSIGPRRTKLTKSSPSPHSSPASPSITYACSPMPHHSRDTLCPGTTPSDPALALTTIPIASHRPRLRPAPSLPPACPSRRWSTRLPTPPSVLSTARSPSPLRGVSSLSTDRRPLPLLSTVRPAPRTPTAIMESSLEDRSSPAGHPMPGHRATPGTRPCRQMWGDRTYPNRARGT